MSLLKNTKVNEKIDFVFNEFKCEAEVNLSFGFALINFRVASCRKFYAHENNTFTDKFQITCTAVDINNLKEKLQNTDFLMFALGNDLTTNGKFTNLQT